MPLEINDDIGICIDILKRNMEYDSVATVSEVHGNQHPLKLHNIDHMELSYFDADGINHHNRQTIKNTLYWRNGACYASRTIELMSKKKIFETKCAPVLIQRPIISIDNIQDAKIAGAIERCIKDGSWNQMINTEDNEY